MYAKVSLINRGTAWTANDILDIITSILVNNVLPSASFIDTVGSSVNNVVSSTWSVLSRTTTTSPVLVLVQTNLNSTRKKKVTFSASDTNGKTSITISAADENRVVGTSIKLFINPNISKIHIYGTNTTFFMSTYDESSGSLITYTSPIVSERQKFMDTSEIDDSGSNYMFVMSAVDKVYFSEIYNAYSKVLLTNSQCSLSTLWGTALPQLPITDEFGDQVLGLCEGYGVNTSIGAVNYNLSYFSNIYFTINTNLTDMWGERLAVTGDGSNYVVLGSTVLPSLVLRQI